MKKVKIFLFIVLAGLFAVSCNSFLDESPDNRAEIDSKEKIRQLLVSAYPEASYFVMTEMASDNADEISGTAWSAEQVQEQIYKWGEITSIDEDSPHLVWQSFYSGVAAANAVLETIRRLENPESANAQRAEALLCRAYCEFVLVNLFAKPYGATSDQDMGVPYPLVPETSVNPQYDRLTVALVYDMINADIEEALPLVDNSAYPYAPKYHFNREAAYAFAARFNLYYRQYDKVIAYSNEVLGSNPASKLRDWARGGTLTPNNNVQPDWFISPENQATLMVISAETLWPWLHGPRGDGTKYGHGRLISTTETMESPTPWGSMGSYVGDEPFFRYGVFWSSQIPKIIVRKLGEYFKYTDPVAGIGYVYTMQPVFTTDETLLCRAEAYILTGEYDKAVDDMNIFMQAFTLGSPVSRQDIVAFYASTAYYTSTAPTVKKKLNPDFVFAGGVVQENLIHCILHLRRMLTIHEGLRWFDIRRYGVEISRRTVGNRITETDVLPKDDLRRTFQLPAAVIAAGLPANPRNTN
ncbi:MAG: RagB/SusD family nutrient uptake outer membrane protein [Prevotellaceae bacterium]|jgi:hypothetical protein|nr:RagB/SusD family nutrient uptake outer membrane protein [Prevotellaceae bacterium]